MLQLPQQRWIPEAYAFGTGLTPLGCRTGNCYIDPDQLNLPSTTEPLVVETAGGVMALSRNWLQIEQLERWQLPIVLVGRSGLGTLNHTLLSLKRYTAAASP